MTEKIISERLAKIQKVKSENSLTFRIVLTPELLDLGCDENTEFVKVSLIKNNAPEKYIKIEVI